MRRKNVSVSVSLISSLGKPSNMLIPFAFYAVRTRYLEFYDGWLDINNLGINWALCAGLPYQTSTDMSMEIANLYFRGGLNLSGWVKIKHCTRTYCVTCCRIIRTVSVLYRICIYSRKYLFARQKWNFKTIIFFGLKYWMRIKPLQNRVRSGYLFSHTWKGTFKGSNTQYVVAKITQLAQKMRKGSNFIRNEEKGTRGKESPFSPFFAIASGEFNSRKRHFVYKVWPYKSKAVRPQWMLK